jgi:hypothetical protein
LFAFLPTDPNLSNDSSAFRERGDHEGLRTNMQPRLPYNMVSKAKCLIKTASDPARVKLILKDGRTVYDVWVGEAGEIAQAGGRPIFEERDLRFRPSDIVDCWAIERDGAVRNDIDQVADLVPKAATTETVL